MMDKFLLYFSSAGGPQHEPQQVRVNPLPLKNHTVGDQPEAGQIKFLGVSVEKVYMFEAHANQVATAVRSKVEKMSKVVTLLDY